MGKRWIGLIFVMLVLIGVAFAFVHNGDLVSVRVNGYTMTLDEAFVGGYLKAAGNVASANGTVDFGVSYHDGDEVFVNVNGNELSLQDAIDGAGLCSNAAHSYSGNIINGHSAGDIMVSGKSLQARINDKEFCCAPQCSGKICGDDGCGGSCGACNTCKNTCFGGTCVATSHASSECATFDSVNWYDSCGNLEPVENCVDYSVEHNQICAGNTIAQPKTNYVVNCVAGRCTSVSSYYTSTTVTNCVNCVIYGGTPCCDNDLDGYCGNTGHDCDDSNANDQFRVSGNGCSGISNTAFGCTNYHVRDIYNLGTLYARMISCQDNLIKGVYTPDGRTIEARCWRGSDESWTLCV
jgi:hypothetical protein